MKILKLNEPQGKDVYVNLDKVCWMRSQGQGTRIFFDNDHALDVAENPTSIIAKSLTGSIT